MPETVTFGSVGLLLFVICYIPGPLRVCGAKEQRDRMITIYVIHYINSVWWMNTAREKGQLYVAVLRVMAVMGTRHRMIHDALRTSANVLDG